MILFPLIDLILNPIRIGFEIANVGNSEWEMTYHGKFVIFILLLELIKYGQSLSYNILTLS